MSKNGDVAHRKGEKSRLNSADSAAQPRLFDVNRYHGSFTEPFKVPAHVTKKVVKEQAPPRGYPGGQNPLYLEYPSTEEHLKRAYAANIKSATDPGVIESLSAARTAREHLGRGDYTELAKVLEEVREGSEQITEKDIEGARQYATPEFIEKFVKVYGMEPPAIGITIPQDKWNRETSEADPSNPSESEALAAKLGLPAWTNSVSVYRTQFKREPYNKTGIALLSSEAGEGMKNHELLHSAYDLYRNHCGLVVSPGEDAHYMIPEIETWIVDEINAYRSRATFDFVGLLTERLNSDPEFKERMAKKFGTGEQAERKMASLVREEAWERPRQSLKTDYLSYQRETYSEKGFDEKELKKITEITSSSIDGAIDAVRYMQDVGVPESEITKRLLAVGSTLPELLRGEFHSPLEDVIAWEKYTEREVKAGKYAPSKKKSTVKK